jgi:hypothetical protein
MGKLGFFIPRTLSTALSFARTGSESTGVDVPPFHVQDGETTTDAEARLRRRPGWSRNGGDSLPNRVVRIGRSLISSGTSSASTSRAPSQAPLPLSSVPTGAREGDEAKSGSEEGGSERGLAGAVPGPGEGVIAGRTIRFHDEQQRDKAAVGKIGDKD